VCIAACLASNSTFAALQAGQCYFSDDALGDNQGFDQCTTSCPGTWNEYCGNDSTDPETGAISVFKRVISEVLWPAPKQLVDWQYSGCFYSEDWYNARAAANDSIFDTADNVQDTNQCSITCFYTNDGYRYAGLYRDQCICTNVGIEASLWVGDGQCSVPYSANSGEACGGFSVDLYSLVTLYTGLTTPSTTLAVIGSAGSDSTYTLGWYVGGTYLLDILLTGLQISSLTNPTPDMNGATCIETCLAQSYTYALTVGGFCFCNDEQPPNDLVAPSQTLCNYPFPNHPDERCGGEDLDGGEYSDEGEALLPTTRRLFNAYGLSAPPVSGTIILTVFLNGLGKMLCVLQCCILRSKQRWRRGSCWK
jgi:hypothetical protein